MEAERLDIQKTLAYLTYEEKLRMLSGDGMWHTFGTGELPRVRMSDGPHGLRMTHGTDVNSSAVPATCFPTLGMLANSWDAAMCYSVGAAIGREATAMGVNVLLAPGLNIKRNPLGGRNFEYMSEDPFLAGELGKAYVSGVQSTGVGACIKHFAANNQEGMRMYSDSVVDERALREIYLKPFEIALAAKPAAVMCAYNKLNGVYCSESEYLLKQVLRNEWKYEGVTVSDWGAVHDRAKSLKAGLDIAMPNADERNFDCLDSALNRGEISIDDVDASLSRILRLIDDTYLEPYGDIDSEMHERIAYNAAAASVVLLRNESKFLPLTKNMRVAVCGELAENAPIQGGGSSHVTEIKNISPLAAFNIRAIDVKYLQGYSANGNSDALIHEAVLGTEDCDAVIVYVGDQAPTEGIDRETLSLPAYQDKLINDLTAAGRRVVVVLCSAGPVLMPWINRVHAILYAGLNGECGALAAVDALYGRINPGGKLAETFPKEQENYSATDFGGALALYRESIFVGYRYYDATEKRVLFPFGHGLSYCDISYDDMRVAARDKCEFDVTVTLSNHSARDAYETVQIYLSDRTGRIMCAPKQLVGFAKVFIEGQTTTTATIHIHREAFEFFNKNANAFDVCDGEYAILAAASAGNIKHQYSVKISGNYFGVYEKPYLKSDRSDITDEKFAAVYGKPLPEAPKRPQRGSFTLDCCVNDIKDTFIGKCIRRSIMRRAKAAGPAGSAERKAFIAFAMNTPLYAVSTMSDGGVSLARANGIVEMANGNFFGGLKKVLKNK